MGRWAFFSAEKEDIAGRESEHVLATPRAHGGAQCDLVHVRLPCELCPPPHASVDVDASRNQERVVLPFAVDCVLTGGTFSCVLGLFWRVSDFRTMEQAPHGSGDGTVYVVVGSLAHLHHGASRVHRQVVRQHLRQHIISGGVCGLRVL